MSQADEVCPLKVLVRADLHLSRVQECGPFHPGLWCLYQGTPQARWPARAVLPGEGSLQELAPSRTEVDNGNQTSPQDYWLWCNFRWAELRKTLNCLSPDG